MVEARFVPYNDETHRAQLFEMYSEYGKWLDNEVYTHYGVHLFPDGDIQIISERFFPMFTATKPPEGILYIIEVDGEAGGMGRLSKQEEGVGEIGSMYTRPSYRRRGYGTEMLRRLEDKATELGYSILRLDTAGFNVVAQRLYRKAGFNEIERYTGIGALETESTRLYYEEKVYMEKRL